MKEAVITITKLSDFFPDRETGEKVQFQYLEIEFAPNCFAKFSLKNSNLRCLQKYNPDMYQLVMNIPDGHTVPFVQSSFNEEDSNENSSIKEIYENNETADDEEETSKKTEKRRLFIH